MAKSYRFADFTLLVNQTLSKSGVELTIEPQVLAVLVYLIENNDRYISTQELHDALWQGRVVSDTAIRRAVGKLRVILGDDAKEPNFIKSVSKRGYRFVAELSANENVDLKADEFAISATEINHNRGRLYFIVSAIFISCCLLYYFFWSQPSFTPRLLSEKIDFPGDKVALSSSIDGSQIVFASQVHQVDGYQLFKYLPANNTLQQLTTNQHNVVSSAIINNDSQLVFVDFILGQCSIKILQLDKGNINKIKVLVDGFYLISDVVAIAGEAGFYFNGLKESNGNTQLYYYDTALQTVIPISKEFIVGEHTYKTAVSPNAELLATITLHDVNNQHEIRIKDRHSQSVLKRYYHPSSIYDIEWLDAHTLVILDSIAMTSINLASGEKKQLLNKHNITEISVGKKRGLIALQNEISSGYFTEYNIEQSQLVNAKIIDSSKSVLQIRYIGSGESYLLYKKNHDQYDVILKENNQEKILFSSTKKLRIIDFNLAEQQLLLKLDNRYLLVDIKSSEKIYITQPDQFISDTANFISDNDFILYAEKSRQGWRIIQYEIKTGLKSELFQGFKIIKPRPEGYILIDEDDGVVQYDKATEQFKKLDIELLKELNSQWVLLDKDLYWMSFDLGNKYLNKFDILTEKLQRFTVDSTLSDLNFDLNNTGTKVVVKVGAHKNTEIVSLPSCCFKKNKSLVIKK